MKLSKKIHYTLLIFFAIRVEFIKCLDTKNRVPNRERYYTYFVKGINSNLSAEWFLNEEKTYYDYAFYPLL